MNPQVDLILAEGCGRCQWHQTPKCQVHTWKLELPLLREILLSCGLTEEVKWGQPCYTDNGRNIIILAPFKNYAALNFFNGALLPDPHGLLIQPTENTQAGRQLRITDSKFILDNRDLIATYIHLAIEAERSGEKIISKKTEEYPLPDELLIAFKNVNGLEQAFRQLTPGRQRAYLLHFNQPKQSATKTSRIEKSISDIMAGKGFNEDYRNKKR